MIIFWWALAGMLGKAMAATKGAAVAGATKAGGAVAGAAKGAGAALGGGGGGGAAGAGTAAGSSGSGAAAAAPTVSENLGRTLGSQFTSPSAGSGVMAPTQGPAPPSQPGPTTGSYTYPSQAPTQQKGGFLDRGLVDYISRMRSGGGDEERPTAPPAPPTGSQGPPPGRFSGFDISPYMEAAGGGGGRGYRGLGKGNLDMGDNALIARILLGDPDQQGDDPEMMRRILAAMMAQGRVR